MANPIHAQTPSDAQQDRADHLEQDPVSATPPRVDGQPISPTDARQGEIILRKPWQRKTFIAGLVGIVVVAVVAGSLI